MAIKLATLTTLEQEDVDAKRTLLISRLQEYDPSLYLKRGALHDLLVQLHAVLLTATQDLIDQVRRSSSLDAIVKDPKLADDDIVDDVLSSLGLTRRKGTAATGQVTIVLSALVPVTIQEGATFVAGGQVFASDSAFSARTDKANVILETDRLIEPQGDDNYAFTIDVTAAEVGAGGRLARGTAVAPDAAIPSFVRAYASDAFSGGTSEETNKELAARQAAGLSARTTASRTSISGLVADTEDFEDVKVSVVGYGDAEQQRYHSIFPVSFGGRVDVWVMPQVYPASVTLTKKATLVGSEDSHGIWQCSIGRDDAPGFYEVSKVFIDGAEEEAGYEVITDTRGVNITADDDIDLIPDIDSANPVEGAYSRFQTASVIKFVDTDTDISNLTVGKSTASYEVVVSAMPLISELQEFLGGTSVMPAASDILVRAAVPCFLSINLTIEKQAGEDDPDAADIKADVVEAVAKIGFAGRLSVGTIAQAVQGNLSGKQTLAGVDMIGRIRRPDGTTKYIRSGSLLSVPDEPAKLVSQKTVAFLLTAADVDVTISSVA